MSETSTQAEGSEQIITNLLRKAFFLFAITFFIIAIIPIIYDAAVNFPVSIVATNFWQDASKTATILINLAFAVISVMITMNTYKRFKENKKPSPLLLAMMFFFLIFAMIVQVVASMTDFSKPVLFSEFLDKSPWLFLGASVFFQFLFILDVFKDGVLNPKNRPMIMFFIIVIAIMFFVFIFSLFNDYFKFFNADIQEIMVIGGSVVALVVLMIAFIIQANSSFKMMKKLQEAIYRHGVLFIGLSGICFIAVLFSMLFAEIARNFIDDDILKNAIVNFTNWFSPAMTLAGGVLIYLGYIYPSRLRKEGT